MKLTHILMALAAATALVAVDGTAIAQPKDKDSKEHGASGKQKKALHQNGKALLGDRIKTNGKHKLEQRGKHTAYANTKGGKITGVVVENDQSPVPVRKYKSTKKMAAADGLQAVSLQLAQAQYMGTTWIGYAYTDEWGDEVIYWYEYDMIYDGDTGATEYIPVY